VLNHTHFLDFFFHLTEMSFKRYKKEVQQLGENIRRLRKEKGISQFALEALTDIDRADISRIENGQIDIHLSRIIKLAEGLEVSTKELFEF
jgi:transcriptional regulator with XRE-family HTH domain